MGETNPHIRHCGCGRFPDIVYCGNKGFMTVCVLCNWKSGHHRTPDEALKDWNDRILPGPTNSVLGGEWKSEGEIVYADEVDGWRKEVANVCQYTSEVDVKRNTARLIAASKRMYRLLEEVKCHGLPPRTHGKIANLLEELNVDVD